ncbi:MAG TPA: ubiquitin-activating E1 FCCH domain-containing protein [Mariprofundaceae bacterium]|nr:ubiquitin-activating E1 FCCH domain-containing protein [Mariprofundaceae bacterium]
MAKLIQPNFSKGEVAPQLHGRVDSDMYRQALRKAHNTIIHTYGGISNRSGTVFIGPLKDHSEENARLIPFQYNTTDEYMLEFGDQYMRVIRNDGHVVETAVNISTIAKSGMTKVTTAAAHGYSNGDEIYIEGVVGMTEVNKRRFLVANKTATTFTLQDQFTGTDVDSTSWSAYVSGGTVARVFTLTTPYLSADLPKLKYVQSADTMTLVHPDYDPRDLTRTDHDVWSLDVITFAPAQTVPTNVTATPDSAGATTYYYGVTITNALTYEESLVGEYTLTTGATTPANTVSWDASSAALQYRVYRKENGLYGFIGATEDSSFYDNNIDPDTLDGPPISRTPFSATDAKPGAVTYYEQRLCFGGTTNQPDTLYTSQSGHRTNMSIRFPLQDDDAITATLNSQEVNEIRHLAAGEDLLIFTSGSEWRANSGGQAAAFSPLTQQYKPQSQWGCSHIRPIRVGDEYIFAENGNARVRTMGFSYQIDGYTGQNLNTLSQHMLANDAPDEYILRDWCFQYFPEPRLIAVRTDGQILTMTYDKNAGVIAWTTWDTEGLFEATASLRRGLSSVEDAIFFVVKRKVNGNWIRTIERLHTRKFADERDGFFIDAGSSYDPQVQITGILESSGTVVITTANAHGYQVGDVIEFADIIWELEVDAFGNEIPLDFLNDHRYEIIAVTSNTFTISCAGEVV